MYIDTIYLYLNVAKCAFGGFSGDDATPQELEVHADGNARGDVHGESMVEEPAPEGWKWILSKKRSPAKWYLWNRTTGESKWPCEEQPGPARALSLLSLPGLNVQWPFSQLIVMGVKKVEVRKYDLGWRRIAEARREMWLVETPGDRKSLRSGWAIAGDNVVAERPEVARIVATIVFSHAKKYVSREEFRDDEENHRIGEGGNYDWDGSGDMYGWYVAEVRRLYEPIEQAGPKGTTGFTVPRSFSVRFA